MNKRFAFFTLVIILCSSIVYGQVRRNPQNRPRRNDAQMQDQRPIEKAVLDYVRSIDSETADQLEALKNSHPNLYKRQMERLGKEMQRLNQVKETDSDHYESLLEEKKLEFETLKLVRKMRKTEDESERSAMEKQLLNLLNKQFDLRQENRLKEIAKLEARITELKSAHQTRLENKSEIVDRRFNQLIGSSAELEW
jgi:hypothetical protein